MGATMEATDSTRKASSAVSPKVSVACLLFSTMALVPQAIRAADLEGGVTVGGSHTDNVFLATEPFGVDDTVLRASPFLSLEHQSPGFDAIANYTFDWYRYTDLKTESSFHAYDVRLIGKLLEDDLSLQVGGSRKQVVKNPNESIPSGRLPLNANLADKDELFVMPRFYKTFGSAVTVDASYRFADTGYNDAAIQDNENHEARFLLENYAQGTGLTWALRYEILETDYEISPAWEFEKGSAELGFWLNSEIRFFGSGGKESRWDDLVDRSPQDGFWEAGIAVARGPNFNAEFAAGDRSFGSSWRGDIDYTFKRGATNLSYNETPTTVGFNRDRLPEDTGLGEGPNDFLTAPGQSERFIQKRLQWSLDLALRRTSIAILAYDEERSGRIDIDGEPLVDQEQSGLSASVTWEMGRRSEIVVSGSVATRKVSATADTDIRQAGLAANYRIGPSLSLTLLYDYSEEQPNGGSSSRDYSANVLSLLATYTFQSSL